ncbi:MAG: TRAP transporter small permease [Verrucomicrobia bacterium]|nr:TRAP transporter small permease [Verrucomicrobiota bacterium]
MTVGKTYFLAFAHFAARILQWVLVVLFAALVLDVLWGVFSRYVLGTQSRWTEEVAIYLLIWVSLLGAAITYRDRGHLGFDYLISRMHPDAKPLAARLAECICIAFIAYTLVYGGGGLMLRSLANGQITPALGWQVGWLYSVIPLSGGFFLLFACEHLMQPLPEDQDHDA